MKKKQVLLAVFAATMLTPTVAWAQYPQISGEAKENYTKMMTEERKRSDEAWAKALPIVQKEAREGRPYIPWAGRPYDLPQADIPSFPGAEGGGMYSFGGRGGKVITVTNLNDRGPGSFREACETGGARIIVFNVAGIIRLESPIIVRAPYVTIAGQTAPGDGVCIAGESFWVDTHDVVVRHMRFRRGETKVWHRDDSFGGNPVGNIMIDHCSCTWGLDENISFYRHMYDPSEGQYESKDLKLPTVNVTIQNTISAKALDTYNHAFGSTLGGENCAFARNLWASNSGRNPSIGWNGIFNFVNNVVFNWVHRSSDGGDYTAMFNMINNYYKPGPFSATKGSFKRLFTAYADDGKNNNKAGVHGVFYFKGNYMDPTCPKLTDKQKEALYKVNMDNSYGLVIKKDFATEKEVLSKKAFDIAEHTSLQPAKKAYKDVLEFAGASYRRDAIDQRIVDETLKGTYTYEGSHGSTNGMIDQPSDVGGWPEYKSETALVDTDGDGIPDEWEKEHNLNPNDPSDGAKYTLSPEYTNLEIYMNSLVNHLYPKK